MQRLETRSIRITGAALCVLALASCARSAVVAGPPVLAPVTLAQQAADAKIASAVATAKGNGIVLVSPFGIRQLFGMLATGARGETRRGIDDTLAIDPVAPAFPPPDVPGLVSGNSIWLDRGFRPDPKFVSNVGRDYGAGVNVRDFSSPATSGEIGRWVAHFTKGRVALRRLVDVKALAANAFSYDVNWAHPFPRSETRSDLFHATGGDERIPLMHESANVGYTEDGAARYVRLPFTDGNAMIVALPKHGIGVATLSGAMARANVSFPTTDILLTLPRFAAHSSADLTSILSGLGMANAFSADADFAPIFGRARIGFTIAYQRCAIDVDERGVRMAALTVAVVIQGPQRVIPPFRVDRPFAFAVVDTRSHAIIMAGIIRRI